METDGNNGEGNAKPSPVRIVPSKYWVFRLSNYTIEDMETLETKFLALNAKYIFGEEICPTTGTPHLQGYAEFEYKVRPIETIGIKRIHWIKRARDATTEDNIRYCSKDGKYKTNFKIKQPLKKLACEENLYPWQITILEILKSEPDDRTIHWYWDEKGCGGKTTFCKFLTRKFGAIPLEGKKNDVLYCAAEFESNLYLYDIERSLEDFVSYGAIEKIKNGYYMCAKYESKPIDRNPPHVFVFANFPPDEDKLSKDRWNIVKIDREPEA